MRYDTPRYFVDDLFDGLFEFILFCEKVAARRFTFLLSRPLRFIWSTRSPSPTGRIVAMEILNNHYACANLIRTGKIEQMYSQLQTKTQNKPSEKMITLERHLARLVKAEKIDLLEARKWANKLDCFVDAIKYD